MNRLKRTLNTLALLLCFFALSSAALAQEDATSSATGMRNQTFVRIAGDNNNPCTRGEPCRTFAGALAKTNPGGEIIAVDTGEYNPVVIDKPVTITAAPGVTATITATAGEAVKIENPTGDRSQVVRLRGLTITGRGASIGIRTDRDGVLHVESCVISGFSFQGIRIVNNRAFIEDTVASENGGAGSVSDAGIGVGEALAGSRVTISNSQMKNNKGSGVIVENSGSVTITDSVSSGNVDGLVARVGGNLDVERCVVANNTDEGIVNSSGVTGDSLSTVRVSNSTVVRNGDVGLLNVDNHGRLQSRGNNTVAGNRFDTQGTIQTIGPR